MEIRKQELELREKQMKANNWMLEEWDTDDTQFR
jgi:hypothetical protein